MSELQTINSPSRLLEIAVEHNADVEKLERLMDMQVKWDAQQAKKSYQIAIGKFQYECPVIVKNKAGHNYFYTPLSDIIAQIKKPMRDAGLSFRFEQNHEQAIEVRCYVTHSDGHSESSSMSACADTSGSKNSVQAIGSTVTYLQRYTLLNVLGIATADADMDGRLPTDLDHAAELQTLIEHVACVRDYYDEVTEVKSLIANDDVGGARDVLKDLPQDAQKLLWRAPSKGGIFTTEERASIKNYSSEAA